MAGSLHYSGKAFDLRTHGLTKPPADMVDLLKARLGKDYDVIVEALTLPNEHIHIEVDPK